MKRLLLILLLTISVVLPSQADQTAQLTKIYTALADEYVEEIDIGQFAVQALKGINQMDKRVHIADDGTRISIYSGGRLVKSLNKPEDGRDVKAWVALTQNVISEACQLSPVLEHRDYEIVDTIMVDAFPKLDHASTFYNGFALTKRPRKSRLYYSDRMIDDVLFIRVGAFNKYTKDNILKTLKSTSEFKAVVLDLRGNPGGLLSEAVEITDLFLDKGTVIASTRGRNSDSDNMYVADGGDILNDKPMVVLMDGATGSSAEVMASALKEQGRAKIVGTRSYGKGTVQKLFLLENESSMAITDAYFYTPSGEPINKTGLLPDVCTFEKDKMDIPEKIISRSFADCGAEKRENEEIDVETALELINKNM